METVSGSSRYKSTLMCCSPNTIQSSSSSTSGCVSADESCDSNLIPKLINHKLRIDSDAKIEEIEAAITKCKDMIFSASQASDERKWLVRYLVELRLRLTDLKEHNGLLRTGISIKGHHFIPATAMANRKQYCDHCSGVIWSIVQASYVCEDCEYLCHYKCVDNVLRVCAHVTMTERGCFEMSICPWEGLAAQNYKCHECQTPLMFSDGWNDPRLCDYTGMFFCSTCHWNDSMSIPARVVHNWDWEKRYVSRAAYQLLMLAHDRPYIDIEKTNPKLFSYIAELEWVHKMRKDLDWIRKYLCACSEGGKLLSPLFVQLGDVSNKYSMAHLEAINDGSLENQLQELTEKCRSHITNCSLCSGKGYLCEICGNNEIIYPFDSGSIICDKCNSLYHRSCWLSHQKCLKCQRIDLRKSVNETTESDKLEQQFDIDKFIE